MMKKPINSDFFRGHVDTIILKSLCVGDRYGYDIIKEIEQKSAGVYKVKQATLYSSLRRLEEQGFLNSYWGEKTAGARKKYYALTDMGKEVFIKNKSDWSKSKDIFDSLVYGNLTRGQEKEGLGAYFEKSGEEDIQETAASAFFGGELDELQNNNEGVFNDALPLNPGPSQNKDDFEDIFFNAKNNNSYVDSVVSEAYKPERIPVRPAQPAPGDTDSDYEEPIFKQFLQPQNEKPEIIQKIEKAQGESLQKVKSEENGEKGYKFLEPEEREEKTIESLLGLPKKKESPLIKKEKVEFIKYNADGVKEPTDTEIINRDYQQALTKLVKNLKKSTPNALEGSAAAQQDKKLNTLTKETMEMGDAIIVRRHDDSVKRYNSEHYFYKNKLMLAHSFILFVFMLLQVAVVFVINEIVIRNRQPLLTRDLWLYVGGILIALALPVYAFLCSYANYSKRKQKEQSFRPLIIFRLIILVQLWVIIAAVNVFMGLITNDFTEYLARFILPSVLSLNVIWSLVIYYILQKSNKYNV